MTFSYLMIIKIMSRAKKIQRKVRLETERKNYFNFSSKNDKLRSEKTMLEQLMRELQRDYLQKGKLEAGVYENRMKSYVARLSEIEETIAVAETQDSVKSERRLRLPDFLQPKASAPAPGGAQAGMGKPAEKGKAPGSEGNEGKGKPSEKGAASAKESQPGKKQSGA